MSYIVKNCPALRGWVCNEQFIKQDKMIDCQDCTDCIMKRIVNECANSLRFSCERILAEKLLGLLDIQEVE